MLARKLRLPASVVQRTDSRSASLATGSRQDKDSLQAVAPGPVTAPHTDADGQRTGLASDGTPL